MGSSLGDKISILLAFNERGGYGQPPLKIGRKLAKSFSVIECKLNVKMMQGALLDTVGKLEEKQLELNVITTNSKQKNYKTIKSNNSRMIFTSY